MMRSIAGSGETFRWACGGPAGNVHVVADMRVGTFRAVPAVHEHLMSAGQDEEVFRVVMAVQWHRHAGREHAPQPAEAALRIRLLDVLTTGEDHEVDTAMQYFSEMLLAHMAGPQGPRRRSRGRRR